MKATIQKWGNGLVLHLPKSLADDMEISEGAEVELVRSGEGLLLKPKRRPCYSLSELVAGITPRNLHPETNWGASVGREMLT